MDDARQALTRNVKEVGVSPDYEVSDHHPNEALSGLQIIGKNARCALKYCELIVMLPEWIVLCFVVKSRSPATYFIISKGSGQDPLVDALTNSSSTFMILFAVDLDQVRY